MSRLVDADTLYNGAMKDEWFRFKEHDNNGKESFAYSCAMQRLAEAPTIDAIPVAWLCEYSGNHFDATGCEVTVLEALWQWKNERGGDSK